MAETHLINNSVFIHIPKTAGTYLTFALGIKRFILPRQRVLFKQYGHVTFGHQDYSRLRKLNVVSDKFDKSAFKYTFTRNPFDRAVSHYFYTRLRHPEILGGQVGFLEYTRNLHKYKRLPKHQGRIGGKLAFRPQCECIQDVEIDFIGRYENFDNDLERIRKILGVPRLEVPKKRYNRTRHKPYVGYYNDESIENIQRFYAIDFEFFGYDNRLLSIFR